MSVVTHTPPPKASFSYATLLNICFLQQKIPSSKKKKNKNKNLLPYFCTKSGLCVYETERKSVHIGSLCTCIYVSDLHAAYQCIANDLVVCACVFVCVVDGSLPWELLRFQSFRKMLFQPCIGCQVQTTNVSSRYTLSADGWLLSCPPPFSHYAA